MKSFSRIAALLIPATAIFAGCAPSDDENPFGDGVDVPLDTAAPGSAYEPPSGKNGLDPENFWGATSQYAMREIQNVALGSGGSVVVISATTGLPVTVPKLPSLPNTTALLSATPGVFKHLIQCALSSTQSVYDPTTMKLYQGWWGLAPDWLGSNIASDTAAQEWVTACMLARLNSLGVHVGILLEGATSQIAKTEPLNSDFWFNEATYFGNMFNSPTPVSNNQPSFKAYVCREGNLVSMCPADGGANWVDQRLCDNLPSTCGLVDLGRCYNPTGACLANGPEHWMCQPTSVVPYQARTIGVQLETPLLPAECDIINK